MSTGGDDAAATRAAAIAHLASVLADPKATAARKDRAASLLLQYGTGTDRKGAPPSRRTKGEEKSERADLASEKFAARRPPTLRVVKA